MMVKRGNQYPISGMLNMDGEILRSIMRSTYRKNVLKYLAGIYPDKVRLSQISHDLNKQEMSVSGCLKGSNGRYAIESSLVSLNLVLLIEKAGKKYYQFNRPYADEVLALMNSTRMVEVEI